MTAETGVLRPAAKGSERAELQRNRILNAAQQSFIEHGFHAASIASIAGIAQMSPGLIYRYFENKNAIILAIIERQLQEARADIARLQSDTDLAPLIIELFARWQRGDPVVMNPALSLETSAEASRDPQIARALNHADEVSGNDFRAWLGRRARDAGRDPAPAEIKARAFALRCFIDGLTVRAVRAPDLDPAVLADSLALFLNQLVSFQNGAMAGDADDTRSPAT